MEHLLQEQHQRTGLFSKVNFHDLFRKGLALQPHPALNSGAHSTPFPRSPELWGYRSELTRGSRHLRLEIKLRTHPQDGQTLTAKAPELTNVGNAA